MKELNQLIFEFKLDKNFKENDFYVSKSNIHAYKIINNWPKWEKNFLNIWGERFSGKTHLVNIFLEKSKGIKIDASEINDKFLDPLKHNKNIVIENLDENINEELIYTIINIAENENKFLLITSESAISELRFKLEDLVSRCKNFILSKIHNPDDDLIYALIIKNLSDRQILIDKKLIEYIVKRIDRSYSNIINFIYKIDKIGLKEKKSIDFKIIKKALE